MFGSQPNILRQKRAWIEDKRASFAQRTHLILNKSSNERIALSFWKKLDLFNVSIAGKGLTYSNSLRLREKKRRSSRKVAKNKKKSDNKLDKLKRFWIQQWSIINKCVFVCCVCNFLRKLFLALYWYSYSSEHVSQIRISLPLESGSEWVQKETNMKRVADERQTTWKKQVATAD